MPWDQVLSKFKKGNLRSGSKSGKQVTNRKQAIAIMLSEKRKAAGGDTEYQSRKGGINTGPSKKFRKKFGV